jgi:hypothetical protein
MTKRELNPARGISMSAFFGCGVASACLASQPSSLLSAFAIGGGSCLALVGCLLLKAWSDTRDDAGFTRLVPVTKAPPRSPRRDRF